MSRLYEIIKLLIIICIIASSCSKVTKYPVFIQESRNPNSPPVLDLDTPNPDIQRSMIMIKAKDKGAGGGILKGSGFLLEKDSVIYLVTARHVSDQKVRLNSERHNWFYFHRSIDIIIPPYDTEIDSFWQKPLSDLGPYVAFSITPENQDKDVVFMPIVYHERLPNYVKPCHFSMLAPDSTVQIGEEIYSYGFPRGLQNRRYATVRSGVIALKLSSRQYLADLNNWPGDSGGLVLSKPSIRITNSAMNIVWPGGYRIFGIVIGSYFLKEHPERKAFSIVLSAQAIIDTFNNENNKFMHSHIKRMSSPESKKIRKILEEKGPEALHEYLRRKIEEKKNEK